MLHTYHCVEASPPSQHDDAEQPADESQDTHPLSHPSLSSLVRAQDFLEDDDAAGERYAATAGTLPFRDLASALKEAFPKEARKVGARELPNWFLRVFSLFEPTTRVVVPELGYMPEVAHEKATDRYGWTPRPAREAAVASAQSLIDLGHIG